MNNLICEGINVAFDGARILNNVRCTIEPGIITGLIGPNGSGKTTLLNVISGRVSPSHGRVLLGTELLTGRSPHELAAIGVFRSYQEGRLFERLTGRENIAAAARPTPDEGLSTALAPRAHHDAHAVQREAAISAAVRLVALEMDHHRQAGEMSYGVRKRTIMGQAIAFDPVVCLLDEPLAGLDPGTREQMLDVIATFRSPNRIILLVEHDLEAIELLAARVLLMDRGKVVADGTPREVRARDIFLDTYMQTHDD
jgi:branched-chain amino acid transport system ATP-binding protein